jgi:hypothetical protein
MKDWRTNTKIYQINTWVWLNTLSAQTGRPIHLGTVPDAEIARLATLGFDAIWLMGVWHRSPATRSSALQYKHEYRDALPDITDEDIVGSAYSIGAYEVEGALGGRAGLAKFRARMRQHGVRLILDFVPNHTSADHPWLASQPDAYVTAPTDAGAHPPDGFFRATRAGGQPYFVAHGRDPYFPPWIDTAQLNAFSPAYRALATETLLDIASQCDGVRCDMAMLLMNEVFQRVWGWRVGPAPKTEYWLDVIPRIRAEHPEFFFMAEVYWGLEGALQAQGFDYTYDKSLYDHLVHGDIEAVRSRLGDPPARQAHGLRFIENHDEPRAAVAFGGIERTRPAAVLIGTLPGAVLYHDGQFIARRAKLPVQIRRQPLEKRNRALEVFYTRLLAEISEPVYREGEWQLLESQGAYVQCDRCASLLVYRWRSADDYRVVAVNLTAQWVMGLVPILDFPDLARHRWQVYDALHDRYAVYDGATVAERGLYIELDPFGASILRFSRLQTGMGRGRQEIQVVRYPPDA